MKNIYIILILLSQLFYLEATPLTGVVSSDRTLSKTDSPYYVSTDLVISKNVQLTIEAGVEIIISDNKNITVLGSVFADANGLEEIIFRAENSNWGSIIFYAGNKQDTSFLSNIKLVSGGNSYHPPIIIKSEIVPSLNNIRFDQCSFDKVELAPFEFENFSLKSNDVNYIINNDFIVPAGAVFSIEPGTNIYINPNIDIICKGSISAKANFQNNINFTNATNGAWGGISIESDLLDQSTFSFCNFSNFGTSQLSSYAGINIVKGSASIEYCNFQDFSRYAVIIKKTGLADLGSGFTSSKGYNTFGEPKLANSIVVSNFSTNNISAQFNCWGTTLESEIEKKIFDQNDNTTVGFIDFGNYLEDCEPQTPKEPLLEFPSDKSTDMPTNLKCSWYNIQSAELFHFQIAEDSVFTQVVSFKDNLVDTFAIARNLKNGKRYYWRAKSINMAGESNWSETFAFKTFDTTKPEPPTIIYPKNNSVNIPTLADIEWSNIDNADKYVLEYSTNASFSNASQDTSSITQINIRLKYDTQYYIRVKAGNKRGWSAWSLENTFTTAPLFSKAQVLLPVDGTIMQIVPCYCNDDLRQDLAIRNENTFYIFENVGNNYKKVFETEISNQNFDFADFDNDGDLDFVLISKAKQVQILVNDNNSFSIFSQTLDEDVESVFFFDYDSNLSPDIVTFSQNQKVVVKIFQNIITGFVPANNIQLSGRFDKIIKDYFDNDASFDFLIVNNTIGQIVSLQAAEIVTKYTLNFLAPPQKIEVRDIDADQFKDIVSLEYDGALACIYNYSMSNNYARMSLHKEQGIVNFDLVDLSNNGFYDFVFSYKDSISIKEYVNFSFFDFYTLNPQEGFAYCNYCNLDSYNNDLLIKEANNYFVYANNSYVLNSKPEPPSSLTFSLDDNSIILSWSSGSDKESMSLSYSIYVSKEGDLEDTTSVLFDTPYSKSKTLTLNNIKSGRYKWRVKTHDNTFLHSDYSEEFEFITPDLILAPPQSWDFEKQTGEHSLLVLDPKQFQDSLDFHSGMYIGVFYVNDTSLSCAGYTRYNPNSSIAIPIWGDNYITSMIKEGFSQKEIIRYKVWDGIKGTEQFVLINSDQPKNNFLPDKVFKGTSSEEPNNLTIYQKKNSVQYISTNLELCNPFAHRLEFNHLYTSEGLNVSLTQLFVPTNTLILYSDNNTVTSLYGYNIEPLDYKISIHKGWNLIPYLKPDTSSVTSAFDYYSDKIICVKDDEGKAWIPQFNINELQYLIPGKAYKVYSYEDIDFYYNSIIDNNFSSTDQQAHSVYDIKSSLTGNSMSLILDCPDASNGSSIAIKTGQDVIGSSIIQNGRAYISIWGDNIFSSDIDGALEDSELTIEVFDVEKDTVQSTIVQNILDITDSENSIQILRYNKDRLLYLTLKYDDTSIEVKKIEEIYSIVDTQILSKKPIKHFKIYDYIGTQYMAIDNYYRNAIDLKFLNNGIYFIEMKIAQTTYIEKLIINK